MRGNARNARRGRARRAAGNPIDPAAAGLQDWQDHQYLPGYYTGGRIPPFPRGGRPNPYGYALLLSGGLAAALVAVALALPPMGLAGLSLGSLLPVIALAALTLTTGGRLLRKPRHDRAPWGGERPPDAGSGAPTDPAPSAPPAD